MPTDLTRVALLVGYAAISVAGMVLIKSSESLFSLKSVGGFALYLTGFVIWMGVILRMMPLSQAFPLAAGSLMLGTQLASWLILKERITSFQALAASLVLVGVIMLNLATPEKT